MRHLAVVAEESEVAWFGFVKGYWCAHLILLRSIARQGNADEAEESLGETRAVEAEGADAAPEIWHIEKKLCLLEDVLRTSTARHA